MSDDDLIEFCRDLCENGGVGSLAYRSLKTYPTLYTTLYQRGLSQAGLLERLGLTAAYKTWKETQPISYGGETRQRWTWDRIVSEARDVQAAEGFWPPAAWWQANGYASLVQAVYQRGYSWEALRDELADFRSSQFVTSRSGLRWRSHAEASLSNFLFARGVSHSRGSRYPKSYEEQSGRAYGIFDMHFEGAQGVIDVEVWGDKPHGSDSERYRTKREGKERFNAGNKRFLGIHFAECYSDAKLTIILRPYIGEIEPYRFERPTDRVIPSTHWSNADELLEYCRAFAEQQQDGEFPTEGWLRKRGKWAHRPGPPYNTVSIYIKTWIGGVRKLRELLGQADVSSTKWTKDKVLEQWREFRETHGMTPNSYRARAARGQIERNVEIVREAGRLVSAVNKYVGGSAEADYATGFLPYRRKPRKSGGL